ncbi:sigma-70 family RNA polymerase sigma factor [Cohnella abietis]|uniref:DNA-directed RNA polymerase sigma-70 factor n=1 Tax=Cohnella abietis TaxID=2507935 RepID=A0A3T1CYH9_9BACL|nr:sigma-70 family RNA polymerase sigma factor [Cohnella abietis]BBI30900.1 DNA-directed RNA polymerase sigma-70 factor [Cohnella abietis]
MEEKILIQQLKHKSQPALEHLIDLYSAYVSTIVRNIIGAQMRIEDIEEVVSDVFVLLWNNATQIQENGSLKSYIAAIARNQALKKLRNLDPQFCLLEEDILIVRDTNDPLKESENKQELEWIFSTMEKQDREIFLRYYFFFEKTKDIALQLKMNESTVRSRLLRGRAFLKQRLIEGGYEFENKHIQNG